MKRMLRKSVIPVLAVMAFLFLLDPTLILAPVQFVAALFLGWAPAAGRLLHGMEGRWGQVAAWSGFLLLFSAGLHWFCLRLRSVWRWRWTAAVVGGIWLSMFAGMAITGMAHQTIWMVASGERIFVGGATALLSRSLKVRHLAVQSDWKEKALQEMLRTNEPAALWEQVNVLIQPDQSGRITNIFVIDRNGTLGFIEVRPKATSRRKSISKLPRAISGGGAK